VDGKELLARLEQLLGEDANATWMDDKTSYWFLWEGAQRYVQKTNCLTSYQDITTAADTENYALDAKYMKLYLKDSSNRYYVRYLEATSGDYTFLPWKDYEEIIRANKVATTDTAEVPTHFSIRDQQSLYGQITGTATSAGAATGGACTLTDTSGLFTTTDYVSAGDIIHNTTDDSHGVVLSITSATALVCALFGGTNNEWTKDDAYVIQPQGRQELILYPTPDDASDTVRVWYIERPEPVFSDYGIYRIPQRGMEAIIDYAAGRYKYRDQDRTEAREFLINWDMKVKQDYANTRPMLKKRGFKVNLRKR